MAGDRRRGSSVLASLTCVGEFSATEALGDAGQLRCSNGAAATFQFQRLSLRRGHGAGTNGSALSFTYGLTAEESAPYPKLPYAKALLGDGGNLALVAAVLLSLNHEGDSPNNESGQGPHRKAKGKLGSVRARYGDLKDGLRKGNCRRPHR